MVTLTLSIPFLSASNSKIHSCGGAGGDRSCSCCSWCTDGHTDTVGSSCHSHHTDGFVSTVGSSCRSCWMPTMALSTSYSLSVDGHTDSVDSPCSCHGWLPWHCPYLVRCCCRSFSRSVGASPLTSLLDLLVALVFVDW
jgi:hypothetical protein